MYALLYFWRALSEAACDSFLLHFSLVNYATARIVMANANTYINICMYVCMNTLECPTRGASVNCVGGMGRMEMTILYVHAHVCTYIYKKPTTKITQQTAHHRERNMEGVGKGEEWCKGTRATSQNEGVSTYIFSCLHVCVCAYTYLFPK